jgi:8-oxo-dGTP diphosphatase
MSTVFAAVKAVVQDGDRFLLLKQDVGGETFWDLPGGRVDFGESPYAALARELQEEVSLDVTIGRPLGLWWFFRKTDGHQVVCSTFLCTASDPSVRLAAAPLSSETIAEYVWITKGQLTEPRFASMYESLRAVLQEI